MAHSEFLRQLGLFTVAEFLTPEECAHLRGLAAVSEGAQATVYRDRERQLDEEARRTLEVRLTDPVQLDVERRMHGLSPAFERHFGLELDGSDRLHWLVYGPGDFFRLHSDVASADKVDPSGPYREVAMRAVSVVVFLNHPNQSEEPYQGGDLTFYGLMKTPGAKDYGFPVDAETGLLVAFPSATLHEVSPVTGGKRYTLVTWFFAREPKEASNSSDADHRDVKTEIQGNG
jgi:predicted 2-oxoglutarate/Fe(II)-dependent dioxygenase YbiX